MGALAHLETRLLPVEPGSQATAQIRVRNTGSVVDQFTLEILGDAQSWATVQPPTLSLFPGAEEMATVTFGPPRTPQVPAGQMPFGLRVLSKEDPAGSVVEEGVLEVAPFSDVFAELAPRTSRGSTGATHDLAVDNRGNSPLNANITAVDPDQLLAFEVRPPSVVADPGTAAFAKIAVRPRKRFFRGASQTRPFKVQVEVPGVAPVAVDGSMLQEAILPPWTLKALLAVLGVLVLAVLVWLFLLRPAIESTARQELIAAGAPTNSAGEPVLGDGRRDDPTATPNPNDTGGQNGPTTPGTGTGSPGTETGSPGQPTPSPTAPLGIPASRDGVLRDVEGQREELVPEGVTLYITDLIFSNLDDEALDATIEFGRRDKRPNGLPDQKLLELKLANFRDTDFHWVTPLTFSPGFAMYVNCPSGCSQAAVSWSGFQR